jgi:translocation and assembly module TamB
MTDKKLLNPTWIVVITLVAFFFSASYLFLNTQKGLQLAVELSQPWLSGHLKFSELNGRLLGPIQVKDLHYTSHTTELTISSGQFDWHWSALLQGQLSLAPLSIDKLILSIKKPENKHSTTGTNLNDIRLPKVLKHFRFDTIDIKQASIRYGTTTLNLEGSLHQNWQFHWQLIIPQVSDLLSESKGQLSLKGEISGNRVKPTFYLSLAKTNLSWKAWQLQQVQGEFYLANLTNKSWLFDLKAIQFKNPTFSLKPIHIHLSGNLLPFSLQGNLSSFKVNRNAENTIHSADIPSSSITAKQTHFGLQTNLVVKPNNSINELNVQLQLPNYQGTWPNPKQTIIGSIHLALKNLHYLDSFIPQIKNSQGLLDAQLNFLGPIFSPELNMTLNLKKGSMLIPDLGLNLKNITLGFHTDKKQLQGIGQLDSGKGSLTFQSQTQLDQVTFPSLINLKGNNLEISHTPEYKITASPSLQVRADTQHIEVTGFISFPAAKIKLTENQLNTVELSNDVVFVDHKKLSVTPIPFTYKIHVKLQLGDAVQFSYHGLRTKVKGSLEVNQTTNHPMLATGELALHNGEYTYYGQSLKLQPHSMLTFANSPIDNPNLDLTANKKVWVLPNSTNNNVDTPQSKLGSTSFISSALQTTQAIQATVGVHLQGYLENPQIRLYANPASAISSQLDILSYLVTGQASNQLSAASLQFLLNAATQTGSNKTGINHLINTAQKKIGIDQLTIGENPVFNPTTNKLQKNTSLIIGKTFSPRLTISYSVGLLDPISVLQINYLLNKHFSLQSTNSNFANGIDLVYKLEKK